MTTVLVIGGGAREHALVWGFSRSSAVDRIVAAPGNPGIASLAECVPVDVKDPAAIAKLAGEVDTELVVVGPEEPLVAGAVDAVEARGRLAFGPRQQAARLEGSKAWMKDLLASAEVPTARHRTFTAADHDAALAFLQELAPPYVVKTDGLAAGKGVAVTESLADARDHVRAYLSGDAFGDAGRTLVIEEGLVGPEMSLLVLCDGHEAVPLEPAQDFKRVFDADQGPNTGGMGAYSPVPVAPPEVVDEIMAKAVRPTLYALQTRGIEYRGILYAGVMLTAQGPKIIEYNVRFGDPECEAVVPRLASDLYAHCVESACGHLETDVRFRDDAAVTVVLAVDGYPTAPRTGDRIEGLDRVAAIEGVVVFHAGTKSAPVADGDGLCTAGGRALAVTATAPTLVAARAKAYDAAALITWPGVHYRRDIALAAVSGHQ